MTDEYIGKRFGRYQVVELIETSDILNSYKAYDTKLDRFIVLKVLIHSVEYTPDFIEYFLREVKKLAQLSHPNINKILDFGQDQSLLYLVFEFISEKNLKTSLTVEHDWRSAVELLLPVADALGFAHDHDVMHRDLKPSNILVNPENRLIITDFSIAKIIEQEETREMTGTTVGLGSPAYMSPEQGKGLPVDYRVDIYSFGIILYELITQHRPFDAESSMEMVIQQVTTAPTPPSKYASAMPAALEQIILKTLEKDPDERYQSFDELIAALKRVLSGKKASRFGEALTLRQVVGLGSISMGLFGAAVILYFLLARPALPLGFLGLAATSTYTAIPTAAAIPTQTPAIIAPIPHDTVTATPAPAAPIVLTSTPEPIVVAATAAPAFIGWQLPAAPVLPEHKLPVSPAALASERKNEIHEIATWGNYQLNAIAWVPNGEYLVGGASSGVYYYKDQTLALEGFFHAKGWITTLVFSPDGKRVATGDQKGNVRVWELVDGSLVADLVGHTQEITKLDFSPDGKRLASASLDKTVRIWDIQSKAELFLFTKHYRPVHGVAFVSDTKVVSAGEDFAINVWDTQTGEVTESMRAGSPIVDMALSTSRQFVTVGVWSGKVELWNIETKTRLMEFTGTGQVTPVNKLDISPSDQLLVTGADDGFIRVFSISGGNMLWKLNASAVPTQERNGEKDKVISVGFSPDGTRVVSLTKGGTTAIWQLNDQQRQVTETFSWIEIRKVAISPDWQYLAYQTSAKEVILWSTANGKRIASYSGILPRGSAFSNNSQMFAIQDKEVIHIYRLASSLTNQSFTLYDFPPNGNLAFLPEDRIVAASAAGEIHFWAVSSGKELLPGRTVNFANCKSIYSYDDRYLFSGSELTLFTDEAAVETLCKIRKNPRKLDEAYLPDGSYLAFGLDNFNVELWDILKPGQPENIPISQSKVLSVAISPLGNLMAAGSQDGMITLWNLADRQLVMSLDHHNGPITDLAFSADGKYLVTASFDGTTEIWAIYP